MNGVPIGPIKISKASGIDVCGNLEDCPFDTPQCVYAKFSQGHDYRLALIDSPAASYIKFEGYGHC
jgi:hypothetical protein